MKIAMAIENFSLHGGGAEAYAVQLAHSLVSAGWEVHIYGHSWDGEPNQAIFHMIPSLPRWVPPSIRVLHFALSHRRMIKEDDFDVILGFGNTLVMNVYQSHGGVHFRSNIRKLRATRNRFLRSIKALALFMTPKYHARAWIESSPFRAGNRSVIIAISEMVRKDMSEYFGLREDEIWLVYNGIDVDRFGSKEKDRRERVRRRLGFDSEVVFLFMAYDFRKKGVRYLLEAAAALRDRVGAARFRVVVAGGSPSPPLRRLVARLDLHGIVTFPGPTKEPETLYNACDLFILPTFYDACSLVVFEAMAAGLPAITTVFNGAAGVITDGVDGVVLLDPKDVEAMSEAMERFLDPGVLESASHAARQTARKYTLENNHRKMIEILREAAGRSNISRTGEGTRSPTQGD